MSFKGAPMLEETLVKWREQVAREARLEERRDMLLKQMTSRFGRLPKEVRNRVQQTTSEKELERLSLKILSAKSLEDMRVRQPRRAPRG